MINRSMIDKEYAHDICVMDDTMCTNKYKYPIVLCFCYDENDKAQTIAMGILMGKTYDDFADFLKVLSNHINIRVFICDRLESQRKAIKHIFTSSKIVFCRLHIKRNICSHCGRNSLAYQAIEKLFNGDMKTSDFIEAIQSEIQKNVKHSQHLKLLLKHLKYYDPDILKTYRLRNHYTSNLAEGIISTLKNWIDHKIVSLKDIIDTFVMISEMLIKKNISAKRHLIDSDLYQGKALGKLCSSILIHEYEKFKNVLMTIHKIDPHLIINGIDTENCNCKIRYEFNLPCYHILFQKNKSGLRPLLTQNDIPEIYFAQDFVENQETKIVEKTIERQNNSNYKYSHLMDLVSPIAAEANRNSDIQKLFDNLFIGFQNLKTISSQSSPAYLMQSGRPITRQSQFVDHIRKGGAPKNKRNYKCGICGKPGHNSATCSLRNEDICVL